MRLKKKQLSVEGPAVSDAAALLARREAATEVMIEPQDDGVAAWFLRVPPGGAHRAPRYDAGVGRFYIVATGSMLVDGRELPALSPVWVSRDEEPFTVQAGAGGTEVMVVQFPEEPPRPA